MKLFVGKKVSTTGIFHIRMEYYDELFVMSRLQQFWHENIMFFLYLFISPFFLRYFMNIWYSCGFILVSTNMFVFIQIHLLHKVIYFIESHFSKHSINTYFNDCLRLFCFRNFFGEWIITISDILLDEKVSLCYWFIEHGLN